MDDLITSGPATATMPWESIAPDTGPPKPSKKSDKRDKHETPADPYDDDVAEPQRKRGLWSYTVLHVFILAVVAFVLGVIIWKLLTNDQDPMDGSVGPGVQAVQTSGVW